MHYPFNNNTNNIKNDMDSYNKATMEKDFKNQAQKIKKKLDEVEKIKQFEEEAEKLQKDAESLGIDTKWVTLGIIALFVLAFTVWRDLPVIK